jgi:hypothetical protein
VDVGGKKNRVGLGSLNLIASGTPQSSMALNTPQMISDNAAARQGRCSPDEIFSLEDQEVNMYGHLVD